MNIHLNNGGVLELFRLYRVHHAWTRTTALNFLTKYRTHAGSIASLRRLLSDRRPPTSITQAPVDVVLRQAADLLASGRLVAVRDRESFRWDGTAALLGNAKEGIWLMWRDGMHGVQDASSLLGCLPAINKTRSPIRSLRNLVTETIADYDEMVLTDEELLARLEKSMDSRELVAVYHWPHGQTDAIPEAPAYEAPAAERGGPAPDEPDPNTFSSGHSANDQAATLRAAAESGVPFCEVCERANAGQSGVQ